MPRRIWYLENRSTIESVFCGLVGARDGCRGRFHFHSKAKMWNGISQFHDTWNLEYSTGIGIELAGTNHTSLRRNKYNSLRTQEIRQGVAPVPRKG